jgi:peptidyl-tRNA hydrolase
MGDAIKQVIIVNGEVPWGVGRLMAHVAHASWLSVMNQSHWKEEHFIVDTSNKAGLKRWLEEEYTKVVLNGKGREALLELQRQAEERGLATGLMEEDGETTALAIGPDFSSKISPLTRGIPLY